MKQALEWLKKSPEFVRTTKAAARKDGGSPSMI